MERHVVFQRTSTTWRMHRIKPFHPAPRRRAGPRRGRINCKIAGNCWPNWGRKKRTGTWHWRICTVRWTYRACKSNLPARPQTVKVLVTRWIVLEHLILLWAEGTRSRQFYWPVRWLGRKIFRRMINRRPRPSNNRWPPLGGSTGRLGRPRCSLYGRQPCVTRSMSLADGR